MNELNYDDIVRILDQNGFMVSRKAAARDYDKYLDHNEFRYILWLDRVFQKIQTVPGHIIEIGVARGRNAVLFGHLIKMNGEDSIRNYYGFDTFDGYTNEDLRRSPHLSDNEWKGTTLEFVKERIHLQSLQNTCHLFSGDIKEIAKDFVNSRQSKFNPGKLKIALLYIDCNAYLPAKFSMDFFKDYMSPGGLICIDEKLQGGETEALTDFCTENKLSMVKDPGPFGIPAYTVIKP